MIPERYLNILGGILLFVMMGFICWRLADGWQPDRIYLRSHPSFTDEAFKEAEYEVLKYKILYRDADRWILEMAGK